MRKIYDFGGPIRMVEGRYGAMFYNKHCRYVGKALEYYGEYGEHEMALFGAIVRPDFCVWEIGANIGSQSVGLAKMVPNGVFVGFEPQIELFKILTTNLCANNCQNARTLNCALGGDKEVKGGAFLSYQRWITTRRRISAA